MSCRARSATPMSSTLGNSPWKKKNITVWWTNKRLTPEYLPKGHLQGWPPLFSAPPRTPGSTAGSRECAGSWGWPGGRRFDSGWMDPAAGWAAGSPPGWCWGSAASPFLPSAAGAPAQPDAAAAAPLPSAAGWSPVRDGSQRMGAASASFQEWYITPSLCGGALPSASPGARCFL